MNEIPYMEDTPIETRKPLRLIVLEAGAGIAAGFIVGVWVVELIRWFIN